MQLRRNRRRGKENEKKIAELIGGIRIGVYGREDILHNLFSVEVKSRKSFSGNKFLQQAIKNAKNKIPVAIVHINNTLYENSIVLMRLKDFLAVLEKTNFLSEPPKEARHSNLKKENKKNKSLKEPKPALGVFPAVNDTFFK